MEDNLLYLHNLWVQYETDEDVVYAINGIELEMKRGETLGLVGETGAGKTTTAHSIMKILPKKVGYVKQGEIFFEGNNLLELDEADMMLIRGEEISMIFQDPMTSLNPVITVGNQIAEAMELHQNISKKEIEKKVEEMLQMVGISPQRKNEYPHQFSGGMKQRVVIAIALACNPKLLIADEPTTALDVTIQAQILHMINKLKRELNMSMLLITHDLGVVAQMCDRVAIMYAGEIIEVGTLEQIYKNHKHPYTKGLFGSIPSLNKETRRLNPIKGSMPDPTVRIEGCNFNPRCPNAMAICRVKKAETLNFDGHKINCHLYNSEYTDVDKEISKNV